MRYILILSIVLVIVRPNLLHGQSSILKFISKYVDCGSTNKSDTIFYTYDSECRVVKIEDAPNDGTLKMERWLFEYEDKDLTSQKIRQLSSIRNRNWINDDLWSYEYDERENLKKEFKYYWDEQKWVGATSKTYQYDSQNRIVETLWQYWDSIEWVNDFKTIVDYNELDQLIKSELITWSEGQWENYSKKIKTYNQNGNLSSERSEVWRDGQWKTISSRSLTYRSDDKIAENFYEFGLDSILYTTRNTYSYRDGLLDTLEWYDKDFVYENDFHAITSYEYEPNGTKKRETFEILSDYRSKYQAPYRKSFFHDSMNNIETVIFEAWDTILLDWRKSKKVVTGKDDEDFLIFNEYTNLWVGNCFERHDYFRERSPCFPILDLNDNTFEIYPNPSSDYITLKMEAPISEKVYLQFYGMNGMLCKTIQIQAFEQEKMISVLDLEKGLYHLRFISEDKIKLKTLVVMR